VLARQVDDVIGEPKRDLVELEVGVRNALLVDDAVVAVLADDPGAAVSVDLEFPDLECLSRDALVVRLDQSDFIERNGKNCEQRNLKISECRLRHSLFQALRRMLRAELGCTPVKLGTALVWLSAAATECFRPKPDGRCPIWPACYLTFPP
jgi:hypothetical protein